MIRVLLLFFVCGFAALEALTDYRLLQPAAEVPKACTTPGPFCETCSSLVACIENPDGSWSKNRLADCKPPSYCVDGACTTGYDPFCWGVASWTFPCPAVGIFPDPFYCNKFHLCVKEGSALRDYINECEAGFGFNIANDLCSTRLEGGECPTDSYPIKICNGTTGDENNGAISEKPSMYYVCEQRTVGSITAYYPYLNVCPGDFVYDDYQCSASTTPPPPTRTPPPIK